MVLVDVLKYVMVFIGIFDVDFEKIVQILVLNFVLNFVCIDVVNGYLEYFVQFVVKVCEVWLIKIICVGNVVMGEMCEEFIFFGVDIVKVGIGFGFVCMMCVKIGVGYL